MTGVNWSLGSQLWLPRGGLGLVGVRTFSSDESSRTSNREPDTPDFSYRAKRSLYGRLNGASDLEQWLSSLKRESDTLDLSYREKLELYSGKNISGDKTEVSWREKIKAFGADPKLRAIDKSIVKAAEYLTRMKEIAESAQSEKLSDEDRIALQMEMGKLQYEMDTEAGNTISMGSYEDTEAYKMLERAAQRIANGEKWDAAEIAVPFIERDDNGVESWKYEWYLTDDANAPTVGDVLKGKGRSVMDSEAAKVSAAELEDELSKLLKQQEKLAAFVNHNGASPQRGNEENFSKTVESLFQGTQRLLNSFARNPVYGAATYLDSVTDHSFSENSLIPQMSEEELKKYDITQRQPSSEDKNLWAAVVQSRASNGWLLSVSVDVRLAGTEPATKTVLRPDPNEVVMPGVLTNRVVATTITKDDPEFYRQTPRVNAIRDENGKLLVKYVDVKVTLPNPSQNFYSGVNISIFA
ncbi:MAG: hypothetical protein LBK91_07940 [Synergistaceae bacterium]|jgi:hypothetical protein|nr:hypothetical protein [Synergistaceae bacterium]